MLQWKRNRAAFTLIELLVVVIIVAVLAAVGIPLLSASVQRARNSEAESGLGTIRTGMRAELAELGAPGFTGIPALVDIGIGTNDLLGRFFEDNDYSIPTASGNSYCITVQGDGPDGTGVNGNGLALKGSQVNGVWRAMNQDGSLFGAASGTPACSGAPLNG